MPQDELSEEVENERERCLAIVELFRDDLGPLYYAIANRITGGDDPRDPDYMADRLMP